MYTICIGDDNVYNALETLTHKNGDRVIIIDIKHLADLKDFFGKLSQSDELNPFQHWITHDMYDFSLPNEQIKSLVLMAVHKPFYAKVELIYNGKKRTIRSLVRPDFDQASGYLKNHLNAHGYFVMPALDLPLKRLATQSGLAVYGKNNISYIEGLGSNFSYLPFYSDIPCPQDTWGEPSVADECENCDLCFKACPTGSIRKDRFLIDTSRCLSFVNEMPGEFPEWLDENIHHTAYDCLYCQINCPMNAYQINQIADTIEFDAEETNCLINGDEFVTLEERTKVKLHNLGMDAWYQAIPRNLKILLSREK